MKLNKKAFNIIKDLIFEGSICSYQNVLLLDE